MDPGSTEAAGPKAKRQLTQTQLNQLAKAREKANAVRQKNAEMKRKEKKLKELQRQVQEEELDEEIAWGGPRAGERAGGARGMG